MIKIENTKVAGWEAAIRGSSSCNHYEQKGT